MLRVHGGLPPLIYVTCVLYILLFSLFPLIDWKAMNYISICLVFIFLSHIQFKFRNVMISRETFKRNIHHKSVYQSYLDKKIRKKKETYIWV